MRWRVFALIIIPTVAAIVLGGVRIQSARDTAGNFAQVAQLAVLGNDITLLAISRLAISPTMKTARPRPPRRSSD
jgi:hypothetical protein